MANNGKGGEEGYWLPPEFLSDDDFPLDAQNFTSTHKSDFCFPPEFPFHFQTHADHPLQKFCAMSTSPQSTLSAPHSGGGSQNGCPNGARSPPFPKYDAVEDFIYLAAGEVVKLRLNRGRAMTNACPQPRNLPQFREDTKIPNPPVRPHTQPQFGSRAVRGMGHVAWDPYQNHPRGRAVPDGGGAAARKACAGTGVFLPRRYHTNSHSSYPSTSPGCSASHFEGGSSAQIHTKPLMYRFLEPQPQPKLGRAFAPDHNSIMARRNALLLLRQRRSFTAPMVEGRDHAWLPQEWSY